MHRSRTIARCAVARRDARWLAVPPALLIGIASPVRIEFMSRALPSCGWVLGRASRRLSIGPSEQPPASCLNRAATLLAAAWMAARTRAGVAGISDSSAPIGRSTADIREVEVGAAGLDAAILEPNVGRLALQQMRGDALDTLRQLLG